MSILPKACKADGFVTFPVFVLATKVFTLICILAESVLYYSHKIQISRRSDIMKTPLNHNNGKFSMSAPALTGALLV